MAGDYDMTSITDLVIPTSWQKVILYTGIGVNNLENAKQGLP